MLTVTDVRNMMLHESRWGADDIYRCHYNQRELFQLEETALDIFDRHWSPQGSNLPSNVKADLQNMKIKKERMTNDGCALFCCSLGFKMICSSEESSL